MRVLTQAGECTGQGRGGTARHYSCFIQEKRHVPIELRLDPPGRGVG